MSYTPTSSAGIAIAQLRRMVSLSTAFQDEFVVLPAEDIEDLDEEEIAALKASRALTFILVGRHPMTNLPAGGAILSLNERPLDFQLDAGGQQLWLHPEGGIVAQLVLPQSEVTDYDDRYLAGVDFVANVAKQIKELSDAEDEDTEFGANHLAITKLAVEYAGPGNVRFEKSRGVMCLAKLFVDWGIR